MRRFCLSAPKHIIYIVCVSYYSSKALGFESVLSEEYSSSSQTKQPEYSLAQASSVAFVPLIATIIPSLSISNNLIVGLIYFFIIFYLFPDFVTQKTYIL